MISFSVKAWKASILSYGFKFSLHFPVGPDNMNGKSAVTQMFSFVYKAVLSFLPTLPAFYKTQTSFQL